MNHCTTTHSTSDRKLRHTARSTVSLSRGALLAGIFTALLAGVACTKPAPAPVAKAPSLMESYRVGAPDVLFVTILPDPIIEREVTVRPDGMVSIDLIGDVPALGYTAAEIAETIAGKISRYKRDANVTVAVRQALSSTITVLGEVAAPGTFPVQGQIRVVEALGRVGGPTQFCSKGGIRVIRSAPEGTSVIPIDLGDIEDGDLSTNILVAGGDIVVVPPNVLARVGYFLQNLLFPFQPLISGAAGAGAAMAF